MRGLQLLQLIDDPLERTANELGVLEQDEQCADGDRPGPLQSDADGEQERGADGERQVRESYEQAADDLGALVGSKHFGARVVEAPHHVRAGTVRSQVFRGGEMLFEIGEEVRVDRARSRRRRYGLALHAHEEDG